MPATCRTCGTPKWRGDICTNSDCTRSVSPGYRLTSKIQTPYTMMVQHGFHEPVIMRQEQIMSTNVQRTIVSEAPAIANAWVQEYPATIVPGRELYHQIEQERQQSEQSCRNWWQAAHAENNYHHQRFPGYCMFCNENLES